MNTKNKEAARTNFLLMKLLYRNYTKSHGALSVPLSEKDYYKKLETEFETLLNQREELFKKSTSKKVSIKSKGDKK